jgi:tRNA pseudouridine55 synthase
MIHGWLILNKPQGMSSTHAGNIVRRLVQGKSLGHAGTLDPFACGVLPLALGEATKTMPYVVAKEKEYLFEITWGIQTDTDDCEGRSIAESSVRPAACDILEILPKFMGDITQIPPIYSAIKKQGVPSYQRARAGENVTMASRMVQIEGLELIESQIDKARFRVRCGPGTYVRSLGRDLALELGTVGHVSFLERTRVGKFDINHAISLEILREKRHIADIMPLIMPIRAVLDDIPAVSVSAEIEIKLRQGQAVQLHSLAQPSGLCLVEAAGKPVAIAFYDGEQLQVKRVFNC